MARGLDDQVLRSNDVDGDRASGTERTLDARVERFDPRDDVQELSTARDERDRGLDRTRTHHLQLPDGDVRERVVLRDREYRLRGSEVDLLETIGRYRAVFSDDLARETSEPSRLAHDLASLERQRLLEVRTITRLGPAESAELVALTREGKTLLDAHRDPDHDHGQEYYGGWVKPRELWHDAALYRMVREIELEAERGGGEVRRVVLDDELKSEAFARLHRARQDEGLSDDIAHRRVAHTLDLHLEDGHFVLPDVRVEIRDGDGEVRTVNLELVTQHYRGGHLGGKSHAGFRMFRAGGASRRGGTPWDPSTHLR